MPLTLSVIPKAVVHVKQKHFRKKRFGNVLRLSYTAASLVKKVAGNGTDRRLQFSDRTRLHRRQLHVESVTSWDGGAGGSGVCPL